MGCRAQGAPHLGHRARAWLTSPLPRRAWQLFDWVRSLPEDHALRALCDEGTYTTMITLCGTWQQLRRALELVDDMRTRSLDCGLQVGRVAQPASHPATALGTWPDSGLQRRGTSPSLRQPPA